MKRLLAIIISVSVILSCCLIGGLTASAAVDFWDGTTSTPVDSDSDGVYEINNAAELAWIAQNNTDKSYILTTDIYVNDLKVVANGSGATLSKLDGSAVDVSVFNDWAVTGIFKGTLDGNGYTVSGVYNDVQAAAANQLDARGLFGTVESCTVKNLHLTNSYFSGATYIGAVFGAARTSGATPTISNCYVDNVSVTTNVQFEGSTYPATGGLVGYVQSSNFVVEDTAVVDVYVANEKDTARVGAVLGDGWATGDVTVKRTYTAADYKPIGGNDWALGSTAAYAGTVTAEAFYSTTPSRGSVAPQSVTVSKANLTGLNAKIFAWNLGGKFYTTAGYPMQEIFLDNVDPSINVKFGEKPFDGSGTEADPYLIKTADDLGNAIGTYGMGKYYKLANDIVLNDIDKINWKTGEVADGYTPNEWFVSTTDVSGYNYNGFTGQGCFNGHIDGDGYSVHGLYYKRESLSTVTGLVPVAANTTIKNLAIENSYITGARLNGGIIGYAYDNNVIDSCFIADTVSIVGYNGGNAHITAAHIDDNGKGKSPFSKNVVAEGGASYESVATGGIIGYANKTATVSNCAVYGTVRSITDGERFATTNPLTNGGQPVNVGNGSHICGIVGTGWNSNVTISDCVSVIQLHDSIGGANTVFSCTDSYAQTKYEDKNGSMTCCNVVTKNQMSGANALTNMPGLSPDVWTKTAGYPVPTVFTCLGTANPDAHSWTDWEETDAPECEDDGEEARECVTCGDIETNPITAPGHSPKTDWVTDENNHWHECNNCDEKLNLDGHVYDRQFVNDTYKNTAADCDNAATYFYSCVCGKAGTQFFSEGNPAAHVPASDWTFDADGHWHECANCDDKLNYAAHSGGEATCTDKAVCDECGTAYGDVDPDNHDLKDVPAGEASHDNDGNIAHKKCNDCDKLFDDAGNELAPEDVIVDGGDHDFGNDYESDEDGHWKECACGGKDTKADHTYGQWSVTEEPGVDKPGTKVRECTVCGYEDEAPVPATGKTPDTGDTADTLPWIIVSMVSVLALGALCLLRTRKA